MTRITPLKPYDNNHSDNSNKEKVAISGAGAVGITKAATANAGKRGLRTSIITDTLEGAQTTVKTVSKNAGRLERLYVNFINNANIFARDISKKLNALTSSKYIQRIIESPFGKRLSFFAGGVLAFFVLATECNKAISTGELAIDDLKNKYNQFKVSA